MGIITLSQSGIDFIITVPDGAIKLTAPNGGTLKLDEVVRIVAIKESEGIVPNFPSNVTDSNNTLEDISNKRSKRIKTSN